jgi:hypothetical protein
MAEPRDGGSFRHLSFYLPDSLVYGLGLDRNGAFGHLFTGTGNQTNYSVERLSHARARLEIPASVDTVLIPDPRLQERFSGILELEYETLDNGAVVAAAQFPDNRPIVFLGVSGDAAFEVSSETDHHGYSTLIAAAGSSCPGDSGVPVRFDHGEFDEVLLAC